MGEAGARVDVVAVARDGGVRGLVPIDVGDFWGLVLMGARFVMCIEFGEAWGGRVAGFGGGVLWFRGLHLGRGHSSGCGGMGSWR